MQYVKKTVRASVNAHIDITLIQLVHEYSMKNKVPMSRSWEEVIRSGLISEGLLEEEEEVLEDVKRKDLSSF